MKEYKEMYLHLFNEVTTAIEILKEAQKKCEEMYINASEESPHKTSFAGTQRKKRHQLMPFSYTLKIPCVFNGERSD